jgi:hypothetical protein
MSETTAAGSWDSPQQLTGVTSPVDNEYEIARDGEQIADISKKW